MIQDERLLEKLSLVAITSGEGFGEALTEKAKALVFGGVSAIWIREPSTSAKELYQGVFNLKNSLGDEVAWILSDRIDVALALKVDAVHLGHRSLDPKTTRSIVQDSLAIGYSWHGPDVDSSDEWMHADYLTLSPVFDTPSKRGILEPLGVGRFKEITRSCPLPVIALGGIDEGNASLLKDTAAIGVAAMRALLDAPDPKAAASRFREQLKGMSR